MDNKIKYTCAITGKECDKPYITDEDGDKIKSCHKSCEIGIKWLKENDGLILHDDI